MELCFGLLCSCTKIFHTVPSFKNNFKVSCTRLVAPLVPACLRPLLAFFPVTLPTLLQQQKSICACRIPYRYYSHDRNTCTHKQCLVNIIRFSSSHLLSRHFYFKQIHLQPNSTHIFAAGTSRFGGMFLTESSVVPFGLQLTIIVFVISKF